MKTQSEQIRELSAEVSDLKARTQAFLDELRAENAKKEARQKSSIGGGL